MNFGQVITAMVTPFDRHGDVDFEATKNLVNYLITDGSDALVVAGTTGESPTLTTDEKVQLIAHVVDVVDGRVPVIAGTGSNSTRASIDLTCKAEQAGADAVMVVAPYYNKPSQEGMYEHFKQIASSTSLPVMLYNVPGRTAVDLSVDTIVRLAHIENIVSIKEASGNLDKMSEIISATDQDFSLYSGDDSLTLPSLAIGSNGVVSVASHIIGHDMQEMVHNYRVGNTQQAATLHRKMLPVMNALFAAPSPTPVKEALEMYGLSVGAVRQPLLPLSDEEREHLRSVLKFKSENAVS